MAFCITLGTHDFRGELPEYNGVVAQCQNCGNWSARCMSEWPFFTVCFVPLIPLAIHKYKLVACPICNFKQDLSTRPDVQSQARDGGGAGPPQGYGQPPPGQGGPPQGYGQPQPGQGGPPPSGQLQYK